MKEFKEKFDIAKVVMSLSDLEIIDPDTVRDKEKTYYSLSKEASKRMASVTSMVNAQFSRKLYATDAEIWRALLARKMAIDDVKNLVSQNNAVMIDEDMVMLAEGDTHIEDVVRSINKYIEDEDLATYYKVYDKDQMAIISVSKTTHRGVLIQYYMSANWVTISNCYCDRSEKEFFISPFTELDVRVDEDIEALMEKEVLIKTSGSVMENQLKAYRDQMEETYMSVDEFCWYMKKLFKIKMTIEKFEVFDYAADHDELSGAATTILASIIDKFYMNDESPILVNSAYLKKATHMTRVTYQDFSELLELMVMEDVIPVNVLKDLLGNVIKRDTHYNQLF